MDKQLDVLIGISRSMEKSLLSIDKKTSAESGKCDVNISDNVVGSLAAMANSIKLITDAVSNTKFKEKNANTILEFISGIATIGANVKPQNMEALGSAAGGISKFVETFANISLLGIAKVSLLSKILFSGEEPLMKKIVGGAIKSVESFSETSIEKIKQAGIGISILATSLTDLGKAMGVLALIAVIAPIALVGAGAAFLVTKMFMTLGSKLKEINEGFNAVGILGKGLIMLSAGIATMALVATFVDVSTYIEIIAVVASFALTFSLLGKLSDSIHKGSKTIKDMGLSLIAFSAGLATLSLVTMLVPIKDLLSGVVVLAAYGVAFYVMGKLAGEIAQGALSVILGISVGLFFFSGSLLLLSYTFQKFSFNDAMMAGGIILGFGTLFAGLGLLHRPIEKGSLAVFTMGAGLSAFSVGILLFALSLKAVLSLFGGDYSTAAIGVATIIGGMGIAFAGIGLLAPQIIAGSLAIGAMGAAIGIFSVGMILFALSLKGVLKLFDGDITSAAEATASILGGFTVLFAGAGLALPFIALGAISISLMSVALGAFSVGIIAFSLATKLAMKLDVYDEKTKEFKGISIIDSVAYGISNLAKYLPLVIFGLPVALMLGGALVAISAGMISAANAISKIPDANAFTTKLFDKDNGIIPSLAAGFSNLYTSLGGSGFLNTLRTMSGTDPVQMGMRMVKGMGNVLSELAGGIVSFANFENFPVQIADPNDPNKLIYKSVNLFSVIPKIKTALVGDGTTNGNGILFSLAKIFAEIGKDFPSGFLMDSDVEDGVDAVKGIGSVISELASGILSFGNMQNFPIEFDSKTGKATKYGPLDLNKVAANIRNILTTIPSIFANIDPDTFEDAEDVADAAMPLAESITKLLKSIDGSSQQEKSIGGLQKLADVFRTLSDSADGFTKFTDAFIRLQDPLSKFSLSLGIMGNNFSKLSSNIADYQKFIAATNSMASNAKGYTLFAPAFHKISSSVGDFASNFKVMDNRTIEAFESWSSALLSISSIDSSSFSGLVKRMNEVFDVSSRKLADINKPAVVETEAKKSTPIIQQTPIVQQQKIDIQEIVESMNQVRTAISALNDTLTKTGIKINPMSI